MRSELDRVWLFHDYFLQYTFPDEDFDVNIDDKIWYAVIEACVLSAQFPFWIAFYRPYQLFQHYFLMNVDYPKSGLSYFAS